MYNTKTVIYVLSNNLPVLVPYVIIKQYSKFNDDFYIFRGINKIAEKNCN